MCECDIHEACKAGDMDRVKVLVTAEVSVIDRNEKGETPLYLSVAGNHIHIVRFLLGKGASPNTANDNEQERSPLIEASERGYTYLAQCLLEHGALVNHGDTYSRTPLYWAARENQAGTVELLLSRGAHINLADITRETPLHIACACGRYNTAALLLQNGADPDMCDGDGQSPLHRAVVPAWQITVRLLLQHGVRIVKNDSGETPLDVARREMQALDPEDSLDKWKIADCKAIISMLEQYTAGQESENGSDPAGKVQKKSLTSAAQSDKSMFKGKVTQFSLPADNKLTQEQTRYIWEGLAPSVCLITIAGVETGTGFVVGNLQHLTTGCYHHFLITNFHLKLQEAFASQKPCQAHFGFVELLKPPAVSVNIEAVVFAASEELDYIFVCLEPSPILDNYLSNCVNLGTMISPDKPNVHDPLVILGHPEGKQLRVDPSCFSTQTPPLHPSSTDFTRCIFYQSCSHHGASGSPCFSVAQQKLYCMHSGGIIGGIATHVGGSSEVEFGVHLWEVINHIREQILALTFRPSITIKLTSEDLYNIFPQIKR